MKVSPIENYREPAYPTIATIGAADLSRVPTRWQNLKAVAASLGAAAMTLKAISLEAAEATGPVKTEERGGEHPLSTSTTSLHLGKVTDVCPLPPAAIAGEGQGSFGCVAVNPPVMLPEGEALDIIEAEFKKRGIELVDGVELNGVKAPPRGKQAKWQRFWGRVFKKRGREYEEWSTSKGVPIPLVKRNWRADLGTKDGKIVVEYVSRRDEDIWNKSCLLDDGGCSVSSIDIRAAAARAVEGFSARTEGEPVTVGVFYDPVAYLPMAKKADGSIDWEAENKKLPLSYEEHQKKGKGIAVEQLKVQIESFFQYLAKQQVSDASSHWPISGNNVAR